MTIIKKIVLWVITGLLVLISLVFFPSIACLVATAIAVLIAPIDEWQSLLNKYIKGKVKIIVIVALTILMIATLPVEDTKPADKKGLTNTTPTSAAASPEPTSPSTTKPTTTTSTKPIEPSSTEPTEPSEDEPMHTHFFIAATCTTPKTCSCGATEGQAVGHNWTNATCTTPKTCIACDATDGHATGHNWIDATCATPKKCTVCGTTTGLTAGHSFSEGKCTMCGKSDPDYTNEIMVWIPTNGGTKYHAHEDCSNMDDPRQVTKSEAEELGFTPCKRCT